MVETESHINMAAHNEREAPLTELDSSETVQTPIPPNLEAFFMSATNKFERMIRSAVDSFLSKLTEMEENINASLEFERERIDELQEKQTKLEKRVETVEKELKEIQEKVSKNEIATNKSERLSRRNNIRLVGIPEAPQSQGQREECVDIIEEILRAKFDITSKVERSHRDGKRVEGRPRHILVKLLSYREKVDVMRHARENLKNESYFIIDDLTQTDLKEKQKYVKQAQEIYKQGTKLRFYAGKWRQAGGVPFNFE